MNGRGLLARLEDFRLLPIFVVVSMTIGIAVGNVLSISDFTLTPPIEALKAIAGGTFEPTVANAISLGVPIGLFAMMYPAMTNVRLTEVGQAFRSPRQLGTVLFFNFALAPFFMLLLANVFVADPELRTGLILYGLAPCIAMVIIFTYLAKGNVPMALVFVALNSVVQMLLIPVYARLLIGDVSFDVWVVAESVILYLGLPLVAGVLTRQAVVRRGGEAAMERLKPGLNALSILGLLFTLIVMFALKGDLSSSVRRSSSRWPSRWRSSSSRYSRSCISSGPGSASPTRTRSPSPSTRPGGTSRSPSRSRSPPSRQPSPWPPSSGRSSRSR